MPYRKATLRKMPGTTRKVARLIGELDSLSRRAKNLLAQVQSLEHDSQALAKHKCQTPLDCYWRIGDWCYAKEATAPPVPCGRAYTTCSLYKPRD